jgi:hypothetical protein
MFSVEMRKVGSVPPASVAARTDALADSTVRISRLLSPQARSHELTSVVTSYGSISMSDVALFCLGVTAQCWD